VNGKKFPDAL